MARQFSPRSFLRRVPNSLLKQYFESQGIAHNIQWDDLDETEIEPIHEALEELHTESHQQVEGDFMTIFDLACSGGIKAILEEAVTWKKDWSESFSAMSNDYERAMWTFLNEPRRFEAAGAFHEMDRFSFRWHRFVGHRLDARMKDEVLEAFGIALAAYYRQQGRGRHCHVDVYRRIEPDRFCYFAYPEDAASTDLGYDEQGRFQRRSRQSAFEVIFVYRPEEGIIDLYARGDKKQKETLAEIFCTHILGLAALPDDTGRKPFNLAVLKDPDFSFPIDPNDRIQSVELRLLRLDLPSEPRRDHRRRITLEVLATMPATEALHDLLRWGICHSHTESDKAIVGRAKFRFTFKPVKNMRPKTLTFEVSYPDRCTLKDDHHDQIARKYLYRWGIARDGGAPPLAVAG